MDLIRKFENYKSMNWEEQFLSLVNSFEVIREEKICSLKFQAGYLRSSSESVLDCHIVDGKILGDKVKIDKALEEGSRSLFRVTIHKIKYDKSDSFGDLLPTSSSFYSNFFGKKNCKIFLHLMKFIDSIKDKSTTHEMNMSLDDKTIVCYFIEKI